jgi:hypothetical protein
MKTQGFSLVEVAVALAITMVIGGALLSLVSGSTAAFLAQTESSDMQQRLRVATTTLGNEIASAGAGPYGPAGADVPSGSPPIAPYRPGDSPGTVRTDTITVSRSLRTGATKTTTYWLKVDDAAKAYQLMMYDGSNADVPVVDHIVALQFEYFGDPEPPRIRRPLTDPDGPWTTYGPTPSTTAVSPYAAGENCVFAGNGSAMPDPRLNVLGGAGGPLVAIGAPLLSDGPWCPDGVDPSRWDADLLRIRKVIATVRVEAANAALRGIAGVFFLHGGSSRGGARWLPDLTARIEIVPRSMAAGR